MRRSPGQTLFVMNNPGPRRKRVLMKALMVVLLLAVLFAAFKILPVGNGDQLSTRQATRLLARGADHEAQGLFESAAATYEQVATAEGVDQALRRDAYRRLERVYREQLDDPDAAADARRRMAQLQQRSSAREGDRENIVARIGEEEVTLAQVLYAWSRFNGEKPPVGEDFGIFVRNYLDMALLADEARRLGLHEQGALALELNLNRLVSLNQAMQVEMIDRLEAPTDEQLLEFANRFWGGEPGALIGHIVVADAAAAEAVGKRIKEGEDFGAVARAASLDADMLQDGYKIGPVRASQEGIDRIGPAPGLAARLVASEDGVTTGPIKTARGQHFIRVIEHVPAALESLAGMEEQALMAYQRQQLARAQAELMARLRRERPIEIYGDQMGGIGAPPEAAIEPAADAKGAASDQP